MKLGWLLCLVANAACLRSTAFHCTSNAQCSSSGAAGTCESVGYCSFPDSSCPDGRRFGDLSDMYANSCVGAQPGIDAAVMIDAAPVFEKIGGTVTGLTGTGLVLRDNSTDDLSVTADGPFAFATKLLQGKSYAVTIATPPSGQDAYVAHGSGIANGPVTSVLVSCYPAGSDPGVRCDTGLFCGSAEKCCFDKTVGSGTCAPSASACAPMIVAMPCDSANECSGGAGVCCARFKNSSLGLQDVNCVSSASQCSATGGGSIEILCDSRDATPCPSGQSCTGTSMLGSAYHTCQ